MQTVPCVPAGTRQNEIGISYQWCRDSGGAITDAGVCAAHRETPRLVIPPADAAAWDVLDDVARALDAVPEAERPFVVQRVRGMLVRLES